MALVIARPRHRRPLAVVGGCRRRSRRLDRSPAEHLAAREQGLVRRRSSCSASSTSGSSRWSRTSSPDPTARRLPAPRTRALAGAWSRRSDRGMAPAAMPAHTPSRGLESVMTDGTTAMTGKTVVVTGGTGGIGRATATGLGVAGSSSRHHRQGPRSFGGRGRGIHGAPLATRRWTPSPPTCRRRPRCAGWLRRAGGDPRLDVLVNNVGGFWADRHATADGLERTFAVNHLAAFLLTDLLLDRLKATSPPTSVRRLHPGAQWMGTGGWANCRACTDTRDRRPTTRTRSWPTSCSASRLARRLEGDRRDGERPAPRRGQHRVRSRRPSRGIIAGSSSRSCGRSCRARNRARPPQFHLRILQASPGDDQAGCFAKGRPRTSTARAVVRHRHGSSPLEGQRRPDRGPPHLTDGAKVATTWGHGTRACRVTAVRSTAPHRRSRITDDRPAAQQVNDAGRRWPAARHKLYVPNGVAAWSRVRRLRERLGPRG